jgi:radical SAM superfamily enzyme with C-terminal helix-hairpin-helix motif
MNYPKIVDGKIEVFENFEDGCMDPLALYSVAFINGEGNLAFYGAETDEDFIALANQLSGECTTVEEATAYVNDQGYKAFYDGMPL